MDVLFDKTIESLSGALNFRAERHKVIASNIANIDTPNYKPKDIVFKKELELVTGNKAGVTMARTQKKHLSGGLISGGNVDFEVVDAGDKVDLDSEMAKLAENNLMYNVTVEFMSRKFRGMNTVLRDAK